MATKKVTKKTSTTKPSGLEIEITSNRINFSWKKGETYGAGQQAYYRLFTGKSLKVAKSGRDFITQGLIPTGVKWVDLKVSKSSQADHISFSPSNYFPNKSSNKFKPVLYAIQLRVRGQASSYKKKKKKGKTEIETTYDPQWSGWAEKTVVIYAPPTPSLSAAWSSDSVNDTVFTWEAKSSKDNKPLYNVEYQSAKVTAMVEPGKFSTLSEWKTAASTTEVLSDSKTESETGHVGVTFGRVVRVRARGAGGVSSWAYAYHQYAEPFAPVLKEASTTYDSANHIASTYAAWTQQYDVNHPVDKNHLFYRIGKPAADMNVTTDNSWTDAETSNEIPERYDTKVNISETISDDECMWVRISAEHDLDKSYSNVLRSYTGMLAAPTGLTISNQNNTTHKVDVSCTNNSQVTDSKIAIIWQPEDAPDKSVVIGVIPNGSSSISGLQCPDWTGYTTLAFRAYAYVGSESYVTGSDSVKRYTVLRQMWSNEINTGGNIPLAPTNVALSRHEEGILVNWNWSWADADTAEVAWSTSPNALISTEDPETYEVSNLYDPTLLIGDVTEGLTYYVWVRLISGEVIGPWSAVKSIHLSAAPVKPVLTLSPDLVEQGESVTASWTYTSTDGTGQALALVQEYTGGTYVPVAQATDAQHVTIKTNKWANGTVHTLAVKVVSESGEESSWSQPIDLKVASKPTATISQTSLAQVSDGYELRSLPMTVTVTGAGTAGLTELRIVRAADFTEARPDETEFNGFAGEVVMQREYTSEEQQTITQDNLEAYLDDTARYTLEATVTDAFGQRAHDSIDFTVAWTNQAVKPVGTATVAGDYAYIEVGTPEDATGTETVDIYRLSIDKPELIWKGASFGDMIIDPYPAVNGGYRLCLLTENGDYTTAAGYSSDESGFAWTDLDIDYDPDYQSIDFNGYHLGLTYNVDLDSSWSKDFQVTRYLGGSMRGDWLAGTERTGSVNSVMLTVDDVNDRHALRILSEYAGPAHIRTKDGSSFWANIETSVSMGYSQAGQLETISLSYTRTDRVDPDGVKVEVSE